MKLREKMKRFWTLDVHNHEGFTLVELIIVIAILAILSTGAIAGYSAYVEKAKEAADMNLLSAFNTAINAALAENGVPVTAMQGAELKLENNKFKTIIFPANFETAARSGSTTHADRVMESFNKYLGEENKSLEFQVYIKIMFNNGSFEGYTPETIKEATTIVTFNGVPIQISLADADKLATSTFGEMGTDVLLGKVSFVSNMAAGILLNDDGSWLGEMVYSESYQKNLADAMGITHDELLAMMDEMDALDEEDGGTRALNFVANSLVLTAAKNSQGMKVDEVVTMLSNGSLKDNLYKDVTGEDDETAQMAMTQAALAYGMYVSYMKNVEGTTDVGGLKDLDEKMGDTKFQEYMKTEQAKNDAEAYMSALNMIVDGTSQSKQGAENVLKNGFTDAELTALLTQIMGK